MTGGGRPGERGGADVTDRKPFRAAAGGTAVFLAGILGIFLGRMIMRYETRFFLSREYCGSYRGIEVYKCGEIDGENAAFHLQMLEEVPKPLTDSCTSLYLTSGKLPVPEVGGAEALGLTQETTVFVTTDSFYPDVLIHELFHAYDRSNGALSDSEEFRAVYERERAELQVACLVPESDRAEFFAAAGARYLLSPALLSETAPETFAYFDERLDAFA